jgi:hypothetical protein
LWPPPYWLRPCCCRPFHWLGRFWIEGASKIADLASLKPNA